MRKKICTTAVVSMLAVSMLMAAGCGTAASDTPSTSGNSEAMSVADENADASTTKEDVAGGLEITSLDELEPGTYDIEAELSCYLPAMGGCDFGKGLLESAVLTVAADHTAAITLDFYELVTVTMMYGDATSYAMEGETSYYDGTSWIEAEYTTKTAVSSEISSMSEETEEGIEIEYTYIDTMTFPITELTDTYMLAINIGGTQFGGETAYTLSSTGESLNGELTVYWDGKSVDSAENE